MDLVMSYFHLSLKHINIEYGYFNTPLMKKNYSVLDLAFARSNVLVVALCAMTFLFPATTQAAWTYTLASPANPAVPAANVCPGQANVPIYSIIITRTGSGSGTATMTGLNFTTNAGYVASSLTQFRLWRNTSNTLAGATLVSTLNPAGGPGVQTFPAVSSALNATPLYFLISVDIAAAPTIGNTITVASMTWSNMTFTGGLFNSCTGCTNAGGTQTIIGITSQPTASPNPVCSGGTTTLSVTASAGPSWTYQWIDVPSGLPVANGTPVGALYSPNGFSTLTVSGLTANRQYRCIIGGACSITSNNVTVAVTSPTSAPALTLYIQDLFGDPVPHNPTICQFRQMNFYINPPFINVVPNVYTWKINGTPMLTQNNLGNYFAATFSTSSLNNGDIVTLEVSWPGGCVSPNPIISQSEQFTVTPNQPPTVNITHNFPSDTICRGNQVTFSANAFEAGTPSYQWYLDGAPVGNANTYTTLATLAVGNHNIWCDITSSEPCDTLDPIFTPVVTSSPITLVVNPCYYYVPTTSTLGPYYSCGSPFYDSQLDNPVNYSSNVNGLVKICPAVANQYVTISFTSITLNDAGDRLRIFGGSPSSTFTADTSAIPLFNLAGPTSSAGCGSVVTSNVSGGCLTSHFRTDAFGNAAGWVANITCSPTPSPGPLPGSTCANPTVIAALPYAVTSHTTQCYGADYTSQSGICNTTYTGEDRVYQYTATGPECTSITLSGTIGTPTLSVYTGCPGSPGTLCLTPAPQSGNSTAQVTFPSAGTYYIIVDNAGGPTAFSNYNLSIVSFGVAPANDLPCNAQYIDLLVNANGNNSCTGSAAEPSNPACWTTGALNTTWYSFTSPATPNPSAVRIHTTPGSIGFTQIALYSGNCSSLTMVNCNQAGPNCASTPNPSSSDIVYSNLTPNTVYYIRVDGRNNNTGNYSIVVADVNGPQPYVDGQDCVVPMTICNSLFQVGDPGFVNTGWVCDFGTINNTCMFAGERSSAWYVFTTNGTGMLSWLLTPNTTGYVDYDWILMDITTFGPDQASRIAAACPQINANNLPWVRCNISDVILFAPCATTQYQTGMCPSSTVTSTSPLGPSFCSSLAVNAGQTFLLHLSNWTQNQHGFTIDFNAFGPSPIAYQNPPSVLYWTAGANNTDWFNPVNWGNCGPPNCSTTAIITVGSSFMPVINANGAVCRDMDIEAGASLTINSDYRLDVCRNYVNNGSLIAMPGSTVRVMGTGAQYFDGNMIGSSAFYNFWMNKTSNHMTILDHANVAGNLTLGTITGGKIITGPKTLYVTNSAPAAITSGGPGSYVEGNLKRNLSGSAGAYYWPVGTAVRGFQLAATEFYGTHSIGNILSYFNDTPIPSQPGPIGPECSGNDYSTLPPLNNGYWTMTANANPSSANYKMTLYNLNYTNAAPSAAYTVLKAATSAGPWTLSGNCLGSSTANATTRDNMSGFSVFTSGQSIIIPVPIDLLNFNAVVEGENVLATWTTATEVNNDYFAVERSHDGINFETVGIKKGSGNSSLTLYYSMLDTEPFKGVSYYRLRQVDFDGAESKSSLVAVSFQNSNTLYVFPNPAHVSTINVRFTAAAEGEAVMEVIDILGKVLRSEMLNVKKGLNEFREYSIQDLHEGAYFIQVKSSGSEILEPMQTRFVRYTQE